MSLIYPPLLSLTSPRLHLTPSRTVCFLCRMFLFIRYCLCNLSLSLFVDSVALYALVFIFIVLSVSCFLKHQSLPVSPPLSYTYFNLPVNESPEIISSDAATAASSQSRVRTIYLVDRCYISTILYLIYFALEPHPGLRGNPVHRDEAGYGEG